MHATEESPISAPPPVRRLGPQSEVRRARNRVSDRVSVHADVLVTAPRVSSGFVLNVSGGGLRLALEDTFEIGTPLELEVTFAEGRVTRERARVVWCREIHDGFVLGVAFC